MASAVADQWPQERGAQALGPYGEGLGGPQGGALTGAQTLHTAGHRLTPGKGNAAITRTAEQSSFGCRNAVSG